MKVRYEKYYFNKIGMIMKSLTPIKAIRHYCLGCSCNSPKEVKLCVITDCELYEYRLGKNPNRKGIRKNLLSK